METKKIAVACFVSGALCCFIALMVSPPYWWLATLAGIAGGYVGYEFREFLAAVPAAARTVLREGGYAANRLKGRVKELRVWFREPHPFFYLFATLLGLWMTVPTLIPGFFLNSAGEMIPPSVIVALAIVAFVLGVIACGVLTAPFLFLALIGAKARRCYWSPSDYWTDEEISAKARTGYRVVPTTYKHIYLFMVVGLWRVFRFSVWVIPKGLVLGALSFAVLCGKVAVRVLRLIHSEKRVLCAVHGTLGGTLSYLTLGGSASSLPEQAVVVLSGGLLGALFGVLAWKFTKRLPRTA